MGFTAHTRRSLLHMSALVSLFVAAGMDIDALTPAPEKPIAIATHTTAQGLHVLSDADKGLYRQAFLLQRGGHTAQADRTLAGVENGLLKNTVLAERYLTRNYTPVYAELVNWLADTSDAPAAEAMYHLAIAHKPADASAPDEPVFSRSLKGSGNGYLRSALHENHAWIAGLAAYKHKDMANAARFFRGLAEADNGLSPDDKAAASFWAYRALKSQGDGALAANYLDKASDAPSGFYSLLARSLTGETQAPASRGAATARQLEGLFTQLAVKRAVALQEIGEPALAEAELRMLYPRSDKATRADLLALAKQLKLPAMQMRIAGNQGQGNEAFPMPDWQPATGYQLERALLFAIMRQESGFDPNARSASGAVGLMQLMPATVHAMAHENHQLGQSTDPSVNIALGQRYLEHLMETPQIGDNLIYLTAAYNAGPGNVVNWLRNARAEKDPLLFIESLPYAQTREYVVHVVANYWIYSQLMGNGADPSSLSAMAAGDWPHYEGAERQLVALLTRAD